MEKIRSVRPKLSCVNSSQRRGVCARRRESSLQVIFYLIPDRTCAILALK